MHIIVSWQCIIGLGEIKLSQGYAWLKKGYHSAVIAYNRKTSTDFIW